MPKCWLLQSVFSLAGRLCSGGFYDVILAACFTLRGHDTFIDFVRCLFLVGK